MIPITKNIIVVDEHGHEYEATYPKRAKGLVKNGRARFIDEHTICLACPPDNMEDNTMSDNTNINIPVEPENKLSMNYILEQIEWIAYHSDFQKSLIELGKISPGDPNDLETIKDILMVRETTNQKLLALYEKMYNDLNPAMSLRLHGLNTLERITDSGKLTDEELAIVGNIISDLIHID